MIVTGPVFCNQSIWATDSAGLAFSSTVQAVGTIDLTSTDPFANGYTHSGPAVTFAAETGGNPTSGHTAFVIPIAGNASTNTNPTNIEAILNLPPAGLAGPASIAYNATNQIYLFNECDLIISNSSAGIAGATGTNITIWFQDNQRGANTMQKLTNEVLVLRNTTGTNINNYAKSNILSAFFLFVTNSTFYDYRESDTVQALQIDIAKFNSWLTNQAYQGYTWNQLCKSDKGHPIDSIYIYNNLPLTPTILPATRLTNGAMLPSSGLTIATPQPLYIIGNYNVQTNSVGVNDIGTNRTTHTYPAALLADAITILSPNWNDQLYTASGTYSSYGNRNAANTTVNAGCLEGIVQSNPSVPGSYSGGTENFLRMEEDWSGGPTLTYNGSIVVMFPSIYATNFWQPPGVYYYPPNRNWAFDLNFQNASLLPPLTPASKALIRGQWKAF
jgi:hypothetical protein